MEKRSSFKSLLPFLPLLVLYVATVFVFSSDELVGDESRHVEYANNLTQGFYTDASNPQLLCGPGYPLVLAPFLLLNAKFIILKLLNAFFVFIAVIYFKKSLELFVKRKYATICACLVGLYPPLIRFIPFLYSESITFMVICGLIFHVCKLYQDEKLNWKQIVIASFYLGLLVLIKVIFLEVIVLSIILLGVLFLLYRNKQIIKVSLIVFGGFLLIIPYLAYAYSMTGKLFYLGTNGGEILYHRATPYEHEWGNWFSKDDVLKGADADYRPDAVYQDLHSLSEHHRDFYRKLEPMTYIERDSALKSMAIQNIKANPKKYLKNTVSNIGRFLFHYPFSYRAQDMSAYGYMIPNMFILVLWMISLIPFLLRRKRVPFEIKAIITFTLIYACGIILLGGRGRNFIIMIPAMVLFSAYVYTHLLKISLIATEEEK